MAYENPVRETLDLYSSTKPSLLSAPYEILGAFKIRLQDKLNVLKEEEIEVLKSKYYIKERRLEERYQKAKGRLLKEEADVSAKTTDTVVSAGMAIFGVLFGGRSSSRIGSTIAKGSRIAKEKRDVIRVQQQLEAVERAFDELASELEVKIDAIDARYVLENVTIKHHVIKPLKRDIVIKDIALIWRADPIIE